MGDDMIQVLEHKQNIRKLHMQETLESRCPILSWLLAKCRSYRPKKLKLDQRQKGTYCLQCILKGIEEHELLSFDFANASDEAITTFIDQFENLLNAGYANGRTYTGSVNNKKVTANFYYVY